MQIIKELRQERGLTQQQLAELAGVDKVTLIRIETGRGNPTVETLGKLATALGVEMADLFPKVQTSLFRVPPDPATQEERRAEWDVAVRRAHQLREHGRTRMEGLLSAWGESKERGEDPTERRAYLDEIGELLQQAYDARPTLFQATSWEALADQWPEVQEADEFYRDLWRLVESAGLSIRTGNAQEERPKAVEEAEAA